MNCLMLFNNNKIKSESEDLSKLSFNSANDMSNYTNCGSLISFSCCTLSRKYFLYNASLN